MQPLVSSIEGPYSTYSLQYTVDCARLHGRQRTSTARCSPEGDRNAIVDHLWHTLLAMLRTVLDQNNGTLGHRQLEGGTEHSVLNRADRVASSEEVVTLAAKIHHHVCGERAHEESVYKKQEKQKINRRRV